MPADARKLLAKGALIPGEDAAEYEHFLAEVSAAVKPKDALEWADGRRGCARVGGEPSAAAQGGPAQAGAAEALATVLQKAMPYREAQALAISVVGRPQRAQKEVDRTFSQWNLDMDVVMATALNTKLDKMSKSIAC